MYNLSVKDWFREPRNALVFREDCIDRVICCFLCGIGVFETLK